MDSVIKSIISSFEGGYDDIDGGFQYYNAVLAINTPKYPAGTVVACIAFDFRSGTCEIYETPQESERGRVSETFKITLAPQFNY